MFQPPTHASSQIIVNAHISFEAMGNRRNCFDCEIGSQTECLQGIAAAGEAFEQRSVQVLTIVVGWDRCAG